jgi:hypothetical protein
MQGFYIFEQGIGSLWTIRVYWVINYNNTLELRFPREVIEGK